MDAMALGGMQEKERYLWYIMAVNMSRHITFTAITYYMWIFFLWISSDSMGGIK